MATPLTDENKNFVTLKVYLRNGVDPVLNDVKDFTFNDVAFPDGTQYKDLTFQELQDTVWTYESKNITTLIYEPEN